MKSRDGTARQVGATGIIGGINLSCARLLYATRLMSSSYAVLQLRILMDLIPLLSSGSLNFLLIDSAVRVSCFVIDFGVSVCLKSYGVETGRLLKTAY